MNRQKENIIEIVQKIENSKFLDELEKILFQYQYEFKSSTPMSEEVFISQLYNAIEDIDAGRFSTLEELEREVKSWK